MAERVEDADTRAPFFKCRKYNVIGKALENCQKNNTQLKRFWYLKRILDHKMKPLDEEEDPIDMTSKSVLSYRGSDSLLLNSALVFLKRLRKKKKKKPTFPLEWR